MYINLRRQISVNNNNNNNIIILIKFSTIGVRFGFDFSTKKSVNYSSSLQRPLSVKFQTATTFSESFHDKLKEGKTDKTWDPKASDSDCSDIQKQRKFKRKAPILMSDSETSDDNWGSVFVQMCFYEKF